MPGSWKLRGEYPRLPGSSSEGVSVNDFLGYVIVFLIISGTKPVMVFFGMLSFVFLVGGDYGASIFMLILLLIGIGSRLTNGYFFKF
jgi:hypothetical protein